MSAGGAGHHNHHQHHPVSHPHPHHLHDHDHGHHHYHHHHSHHRPQPAEVENDGSDGEHLEVKHAVALSSSPPRSALPMHSLGQGSTPLSTPTTDLDLDILGGASIGSTGSTSTSGPSVAVVENLEGQQGTRGESSRTLCVRHQSMADQGVNGMLQHVRTSPKSLIERPSPSPISFPEPSRAKHDTFSSSRSHIDVVPGRLATG